MATHGAEAHARRKARLCTVTLALALSGMPGPISCTHQLSEEVQRATLAVRPTVSGAAKDLGGTPPAGMSVAADGRLSHPARLPATVVPGETRLNPGSGFTGPTPQPDPIGSGPGADAKTIARWDVVPFQTFAGDIEIGVTAFHVNGVERVKFSAEGGPWLGVRSVSLNPRTGVWEYWVTLRAADLPDGPVEIRALAYPQAGVPRVLPSLFLYANAGGTLSGNGRLYVSAGGSNTSGDGSREKPFRTIEYALEAVARKISQYDGGEIILTDPGVYDLITPNPRPDGNQRWLTIRPADGLDRDDVVIAPAVRDLVRPKCRRLRFRRLSFDFSLIRQIYKEDSHWQWYQDCRWYRSQGWAVKYPLDLVPVRNVGYNGLYVTDSLAEDGVHGFVSANLVRNSRCQRISGDVFQNSLMVVNCSIDTVDGTILEHHSDLLQYFGDHENLIVYGLKATNIHQTQNFFLDHYQSSFTNCAFVNIAVQNTGGQPPFTQLNAAHDHVLFMHVANPGQRWLFRDDFAPPKQFTAHNVAFYNCVVDRLQRVSKQPGLPAGVVVDCCHLVNGEMHGRAPTTGEVVINNGPGMSFTYSGAGAEMLVESGRVIPGFRTWKWTDSGNPKPDRGACPVHP